MQRAGSLFDTVATEADHGHPAVALKALLDHTLQSWARLGPRAALPVAVRARTLAVGARPYQRACGEAAWALCAWLSGDPAGLDAAERTAGGPQMGLAADAASWGLDPTAVPADIAVWAECFLAESAELLRDVPMPLAQCRTLTAYGAVLTRRGERNRARPFLSDALARAQGCGAGWHAEQALIELRRAGGRARRVPAGQLSPQEKAVARLARAGRTNQQIGRELYLSVNTVETHLAHVYRKLGIRRRGELVGQELD